MVTNCSSCILESMIRSYSAPNWMLLVVLLLLPQVTIAAFAIPVLFDSTNHLHRDLQYHPEQPERIAACIQALEKLRKDDPSSVVLVDVAADTSTPFAGVHATHMPFSDDELAHAKMMLMQVHEPDLVLRLEERCTKSKQKRIDEGKSALGHIGNIDFDTYLTTETFHICLRAAAAWIRAADADGGMAMALTRPPGHHATRTSQNGFCLFNFAAATAAHVLSKDPENLRVSIIDWDVHYGQGVADILRSEGRARYVSIHQTPAFPYMGETFKVDGPHKNIMTIPMPADTTWTCGYEELFDRALEFACKVGEWEPDVVVVCAGYDALGSDELASVSLNAGDYGRMTRKLVQHLQVSTNKKPSIVLGLEGGYQLNPSGSCGNLQDAVIETVRALAESQHVYVIS